MKLSHLSSFIALALLATPALAQQPPNPTNSDAQGDTAGGTNALLNYIAGINGYSTAFGFNSLATATSPNNDSAFGAFALYHLTTAASNSAFGANAGFSLTTGGANVAIGKDALQLETIGTNNTAVGLAAMQSSGGAIGNVAVGNAALAGGTGSYNVALGTLSLNGNYGDQNIAIGYQAGNNLTSGSYNITIATAGAAGESNTLRIGDATFTHNSHPLTKAFIGGISGVTLSGGGSAVLINSNGQLGTVVSSARFKKDVATMGDESSKLLSLRPVTFHYKADPSQAKQYGLIAEEVAKVYPDLVVRSEKGDVESVQYHELAPMLLNELQKQHAELAAMKSQHDKDVADMKSLKDALVTQQAVLTRLQEKVDSPLRTASR